MVVVSSVMTPAHPNIDFFQRVHESAARTGNGIATWWIILFSFNPIIIHLCFLRTLPIPASVLASTLVLLPTAAIICVGGFVTLLGGTGMAGVSTIMPACLTVGSVAAICVPGLVWLAVGFESWVLVMVIVSCSSAVLSFWLDQHIAFGPSLGIFIFLILLACEITRRVLLHSSRAYRIRPNPFQAWSTTR